MIPFAFAATGTNLLWYLTRGAGVVSLLLLTASVVLGVMTTVRWLSPRWPRFVTAGLHRNLSLLALCFLAVHIASAVLDGFAPIGWLDAVIPFGGAYRPFWLGLGAIALDLFLAVILTSALRQRLGYQTWRIVHWLSYGSWGVAVVHGLGTGTDPKQRWMLAVTVGCVSAVLVAIWWRIAVGWPAHLGTRVAGLAASVVAVSIIAAWLVTGPLQPGWPRRAGTPSDLLQGAGPPGQVAPESARLQLDTSSAVPTRLDGARRGVPSPSSGSGR